MVDDTDGQALASAVEDLGHDCSLATSGADALKRIRSDGPDVVLVAPGSADMAPAELCRRLRAERDDHHPYVIVVAPDGEREGAVAALEAGADSVLVRPFEPFDLRVSLLSAERRAALARRVEQATRQAAEATARLERIARTDPLTGLGNRLRLDEDLAALHARALRDGTAYAVAMVDVDHFKPYNDRHGHPAGDAALRAVSEALAESCRAGDRAYRYGGEELAVLFHREGLAEAARASERLRTAVRDLAIPHDARPDGDTVLTVSAGVAGFDPARHRHPEDVLEQADRALYRAKRAGRDRVEVSGDRAAGR